jgi:hypothetical protein
MKLTGAGEPERLASARVSANAFQVLGVNPQHAQRTFPRRHDQVVLVLGRSGTSRRRHMQDIVAAGSGFPPSNDRLSPEVRT